MRSCSTVLAHRFLLILYTFLNYFFTENGHKSDNDYDVCEIFLTGQIYMRRINIEDASVIGFSTVDW